MPCLYDKLRTNQKENGKICFGRFYLTRPLLAAHIKIVKCAKMRIIKYPNNCLLNRFASAIRRKHGNVEKCDKVWCVIETIPHNVSGKERVRNHYIQYSVFKRRQLIVQTNSSKLITNYGPVESEFMQFSCKIIRSPLHVHRKSAMISRNHLNV